MPINLNSPVNSLGYGQVGFHLLKALDGLGVEPSLFPIGPVDRSEEDAEVINRCINRSAFFDPNAPSLRIYHQWSFAESIGRGRRCGFTFFELDRLKPIERHHLNALDCLFVPSEWAAAVCRDSGVTEPQIVVVPLAVDADIFWADELPGGEETVFINAGKLEYRKGHDTLLHMFLRAFTPADKVRLVMLCENPFLNDRKRAEWHSYYKNHPLGDKVEIIPTRLRTQREVAQVLRRAHCGIFPARAEGFNLEAAEMLAMGRHVILTNYAGHTAYAKEAGALAVPIDDLEPASDGIWFNQDDPSWEGKPGRWAVLGERQVATGANLMQFVHRARLGGTLGLNADGINHFRRWTWETAARRLCEVAFD